MNTPQQAVARAFSLLGGCTYQLGTGDIDTPIDGKTDCAGFAICMCYGLKRHRPGFNVGDWSSVSDDLNSNSIIEDAQHKAELFFPVFPAHAVNPMPVPLPGDLLAYPTIRIADAHSALHLFVGHVAIVTDAHKWDGTWASLTIAQCVGPNGRAPGIIPGQASHFDYHDATWPKLQHRSWLLRAR